MKRTLNKLSVLLLCLILLTSLLTVTAFAADNRVIDNGTCGRRLNWEMSSDGTLTITGTGAMDQYSKPAEAPWADYAANITKVVVEKGVASIGAHAFDGCTALTGISLASTVTSIGEYAFNDCSGLLELQLPYGVANIGAHAFSGCSGLKTVTIPGSVSVIGQYAFSGCKGLNTMDISEGVKSIEANAFMGCDSLITVRIPSTVTNITETAFNGCTALTELLVSEDNATYKTDQNLLYTKDGAVLIYSSRGNSGKITVLPGTTTIRSNAFRDCVGIQEIVLPAGLKTIENTAFYKCTALETINIPESLISVGAEAFRGSSALKELKFNKNTVNIGKSAFRDCSALETLTITGGTVSLGDYAFADCGSISAITMTSSQVGIGDYAFLNAASLEALSMSNGVSRIGQAAFYGCGKLTEVAVPGTVSVIGNSAFVACTQLTTVEIQKGVGTIEQTAFYGLSNLTSVTIPDSVKTIGSNAFEACVGLTEVVIPKSVTSIGENAFMDCTGLEFVTIQNGVTAVEAGAFRYCTSLLTITIPGSVTNIGKEAFTGCTSLNNVTVEPGVTGIGQGAFYECYGLTSVVLPDTLKTIGEDAFGLCTGLASIIIPENVTAINKNAFSDSGLKNVYFEGKRPVIDTAYTGVTANCYYPSGDSSWTDEELGGFGGKLTWAPYNGKHIHNRGTETIAPTCASKGYVVHSCECGDRYHDTYVDALEHTPGEPVEENRVEPTCIAEGSYELATYCTECGREVAREALTIMATGHTASPIPAVAPTCTETGLTEGSVCSVCGVILKNQESVASLGHTIVIDEAVAATCTAAGKTEGKHCSVCEAVLVAQEVVPALGHSWNEGEVTLEPTEDTPGLRMYTCTVCGTIREEEIPTLSHTHAFTPVVTAPTCTEGGYTTYTCPCGNSYESDFVPATGHAAVIDPAIDVTCTEDGKTEGKHCGVCKEVLVAQETIPATGHSWNEGEVVLEPTETTTGIRAYTCTVCGELREEEIPALDHTHSYTNVVVTMPTCTEGGYTTHTCACGHSYQANFVMATGHTPVDDPAVAPTCTKTGLSEGRHCSVCNAVLLLQEVLLATGHTPVTDPAVDVTCTEAGKTEGEHCSVCNEVLIPQEEVPALGHEWDAGTIITEVGKYTDGLKRYECVTCGETRDEVIPCAPHEHEYTAVVTPPTCTEHGYTTYTCGCGHSYVGDATYADHKPKEPVEENRVEATCTSTGSYELVTYCELCGGELHRDARRIPKLDHPWNNGEVIVVPTDEEVGLMLYTCTECGAERTKKFSYSHPERVAGRSRCDTALLAADNLKEVLGVEKFDTIIIASGNNFADALAGSYLAAKKSAPILLYQASSVAANLRYIENNLAEKGKVYLLGGSAAVPAYVEAGLKLYGYDVERLSGKTRFDTNLAILREAGVEAGQEVLIATAYNFADSLSASATGMPILLVDNKEKELTASQISYLKRLNGSEMTILGGEGAVCKELEQQLAVFGNVSRIAGQNRYETSVQIAKAFFGHVNTVVIAYGRNFPDGLCGGPLAYALGGPLVLTEAGSEKLAELYVDENPVISSYVLGGTKALSNETVDLIFQK